MADTSVQVEVEDWIRTNWMPEAFGQRFFRERVSLEPGGVFDFDAVSGDGRTVGSISTSGARTASGKLVVGKMMKLRSDILFLLMADADRRLLVLSEEDMVAQCQKEIDKGRLPTSVEIVHAPIPEELRMRLDAARKIASREVSPGS